MLSSLIKSKKIFLKNNRDVKGKRIIVGGLRLIPGGGQEELLASFFDNWARWHAVVLTRYNFVYMIAYLSGKKVKN